MYKIGEILYNFDDPQTTKIIDVYRTANGRTGELEFEELFQIFKATAETVYKELCASDIN